MAIVFGIDIPVLEFLLILNIIMLFYVVISMFEIRDLIKLRKDLELLLGVSPVKKQIAKPPEPVKTEVTYSNPEQKNQKQ